MFKKIIILSLFFISSVHSEILKELKIEGNNRISAETIKVYGEIDLGTDFTNEKVNNVLKKLYSTNFFENIDLQFKEGILKITLKEYAIINSISLEGEKSNLVKKQIFERLNLKEKQSFIPSQLNKDINLLKKIYALSGYNFAQVNSKIEKFSENRVNVLYFVEKGDRTFIKEINFIGDKKIRDNRLRDIIVSEEKNSGNLYLKMFILMNQILN